MCQTCAPMFRWTDNLETDQIRFRRVRFQTPSSVRNFGPHRVPGRELGEFLSAYYLCAKVNSESPSFSQNSPTFPQNSVSSLFRNSTLETVFRAFPRQLGGRFGYILFFFLSGNRAMEDESRSGGGRFALESIKGDTGGEGGSVRGEGRCLRRWGELNILWGSEILTKTTGARAITRARETGAQDGGNRS